MLRRSIVRWSFELFEKWAVTNGFFFDSSRLEVRHNLHTDGIGKGVFVREEATLPAGELGCVIPASATLRSDRFETSPLIADHVRERFSVFFDEIVKKEPEIFESECEWWKLIVVLIHETMAGEASEFHPYVSYALPGYNPIDLCKVMVDYDNVLSMKEKMRLTFAAHRTLKMQSNMREVLYVCEENKEKIPDMKLIIWAHNVVMSRANMFSFKKCTEEMRPYGVVDEVYEGALPTLCPYFDFLNHNKATNVIIADSLCNSRVVGDTPNEGTPNKEPCLVIGNFADLKGGTELSYAYNVQYAVNEDPRVKEVDKVSALLRWGFVPE